MFTYKIAQSMSTEELASLVWDWYKDVHGVRPRWVDHNDRDFFLNFIKHELNPITQAIRIKEQKYEEDWLRQQEETDTWYTAINTENNKIHLRETTELAAVYPREWDWYELNI